MKFGKIILNSFKYPFTGKELIFPCLLCVFLMILPLGFIFNTESIMILGLVSLVLFVFIFPGYMLSVVKNGTKESFKIPKINLKKNFVDTLKLLVLGTVYSIIPVVLFLILIPIGSLLSLSINDLNTFLVQWGLILGIIAIVFIIFSILQFIATARLAHYDSLSKALNFSQSYRDIRNIGVLKVLGVFLIIPILTSIIEHICFFIFMFAPYVGLLAYVCIIIPIVCLITGFSLGLLYSDGSDDGDDFDFDEKKKGLEKIKYGRFY